MSKKKTIPLLTGALAREAVIASFKKLSPATQVKSPVMFIVYVGSIVTTGLWLASLMGYRNESPVFLAAISIWLWFTVLFANFAEALAEGRAKAQANALKSLKTQTMANLIVDADATNLGPDSTVKSVEIGRAHV